MLINSDVSIVYSVWQMRKAPFGNYCVETAHISVAKYRQNQDRWWGWIYLHDIVSITQSDNWTDPVLYVVYFVVKQMSSVYTGESGFVVIEYRLSMFSGTSKCYCIKQQSNRYCAIWRFW